MIADFFVLSTPSLFQCKMSLNDTLDSPEDVLEIRKKEPKLLSPVGSIEIYEHHNDNQHNQYTGYY